MEYISKVRLSVPESIPGEILRNNLIIKIQKSKKKLVYIQAGAGYGKSTLLSQTARSLSEKAVWLSLAFEDDVFSFANVLCKSICESFPYYDFSVSEYLPFVEKENFTITLANALINSLEKIDESFTLILDDLHTIQDKETRELISCFLKYMPDHIRVLIGSRESCWPELIPLYAKGMIMELGQQELAFTKEETSEILDLDGSEIFQITEGWPLAVGAFKMLMENGAASEYVAVRGNEALYSYLFYEAIHRMSPEMTDFLKASACFEKLDPPMLNCVLNKINTKLKLEDLVSKNIFTTRTGSGLYRYHALFRSCLAEAADPSLYNVLRQKAALYYCKSGDYCKAAEYALQSENKELLENIILLCYKDLMKSGDFSSLLRWFHALGDVSDRKLEILVAKGSFLSSIGNFVEAKTCLDAAIPDLEPVTNRLYTEAMLHKARVLRNFISFEESDQLLDKLISDLDDLSTETAYEIIVEKLYNLCWNSKISEAYELGLKMIEICARSGNLKTKAWYERYMSAVYFFTGRMKECVTYYEKSLELPEEERQYLDIHNIGIYAAKAYQMLGDRTRSLEVLSEQLWVLRSTGKYEEMWSGYLFAAEVYYQNDFIDKMNGLNTSFQATIKYFSLADEYAPLFRKTDFQMQWAKMQRLTYSLIFTSASKDKILEDILENLDRSGDYLKSIILARLFGYFAAVGDYSNAAKFAEQCVLIGEQAKIYLHSTLAYGVLARITITKGEHLNAVYYTEHFLRYCNEYGIFEYFKARKDYDLVLNFASENGIEPEITKMLMKFAGIQGKNAYIKTFGGFAVFPYSDRETPLKMRTKKERELFAVLLDAGEKGMTKEEIHDAIWAESESDDIKKLIGVNLSQIKKDLAVLGMKDALVCRSRRYSILRDKIECDFELFENAANRFSASESIDDGQILLDLYSGEYLADFEALWAVSKRIHYQRIFDQTVLNLK